MCLDVQVPHLSPPTLTGAEQAAILAATASHPRDHTIYSLALGTGPRFAEIVGLNVGKSRSERRVEVQG